MKLLLVAIALAAPSGIRVVEKGATLPKGVSLRGSSVAVATFEDSGGSNAVAVGLRSVKEGSRELAVHHWVKAKGTWVELWKTLDFVRDCELDLILAYMPGSLEVTDLDEDGLAETSYAYFEGAPPAFLAHAQARWDRLREAASP